MESVYDQKKLVPCFEKVLKELGGIENIYMIYQATECDASFILNSEFGFSPDFCFEKESHKYFWEKIITGRPYTPKNETIVVLHEQVKSKCCKVNFLVKIKSKFCYGKKILFEYTDKKKEYVVLPKEISFYDYIKQDLIKEAKNKKEWQVEHVLYRDFEKQTRSR